MAKYFMLNKPPGCITARRDRQGRSTVYDHVPPHFPALPHVGRLDYNTEGLLLFTDDGRLAQAMLNPGVFRETGEERPLVEKVYHVKVRGRLDPGDPGLARLEQPLRHPEDGVLTRPARVRFLELRASATWIEVVLVEGRTNQVRLLCARSGYQVVKLRRVRFGPLELGELKLRWGRPLRQDEAAACYALALPGEQPPAFEEIEDTPEALARARAARDASLPASPLQI